MHRTFRVTTAAPLVAVLLATGLSGCHWFKKKNELYTQSAEARPLEVPPDLDRPAADKAMALPSAGSSVTASGAAAKPAALGFTAAGERDAVFAKVGEVLAATSGVQIASKAEILGTYDVDYMDAKFLVRVTKAGDGSYVSAVDPRGLPPSGEAAGKLIAALKAAIAP
ncbi:hypothetical protein H9L17_14595 [Thermomonas brevis]|uniref:Beta-barrel assembly machine subunit BamC n=1 Tax=Thermomonas brevis TaxID=215691 RepID=A0A7G9QSQ1_9GAMM|nr:hypothetical protein [Thermomonas brevis]QNN46376.1 hypothetical protein H9L17_14595 [Thermomonas brevis]